MNKNNSNVNINTGKSPASTDTYQHKGATGLKEGRPNYPEQTEIDNDEVTLEQNQTLSHNPKGAISIRFLLWQSVLYTILFTVLFNLLF